MRARRGRSSRAARRRRTVWRPAMRRAQRVRRVARWCRLGHATARLGADGEAVCPRRPETDRVARLLEPALEPAGFSRASRHGSPFDGEGSPLDEALRDQRQRGREPLRRGRGGEQAPSAQLQEEPQPAAVEPGLVARRCGPCVPPRAGTEPSLRTGSRAVGAASTRAPGGCVADGASEAGDPTPGRANWEGARRERNKVARRNPSASSIARQHRVEAGEAPGQGSPRRKHRLSGEQM